MEDTTDSLRALSASDLFALLTKWGNRAANFRAFAGEHDLAKQKGGISDAMRKHEERCEKHMDACCRMIEDCAQELRDAMSQANVSDQATARGGL